MAAYRRRIGVASSFVLLVIASVFGVQLLGGGARPERVTMNEVVPLADTFTSVRSGMQPTEVRGLLGSPVRVRKSLAEGLAWPEPEVTCWYFPGSDPATEYQVCFVEGAVRSFSSYSTRTGS